MPDSLHVTVLFFAAARERTGEKSASLTLRSPATVADALAELTRRFPSLAPLLPHLRVAVDQAFVERDASLPDGAELALIPPVSGGSGHFRVVDRPLSLDEVIEAVRSDERGGLVTFSGAVRNQTRGKRVVRLEYEAYAPMAERKLEEIAGAIRTRLPLVELAVVHRVGILRPGELAVVIAAASPHRQDAFAACQECIDWLKRDVPIWKKEVYEDGEIWVGLGP